MRKKAALPYVFLVAGAALMAVFVLFALFPSLFTPYSPTDMFEPWQECSAEHPLGTNDMGYDVFAEIVYATDRTLLVGLASALAALCLGTVFGLLAGYCGGFAGALFDGIVDIFVMLPKLPVVIVLAAFSGGETLNVIIIIACLSWSGTARAVRAKVKHLKNMPFVDTLRGLGFSQGRIVFGHIMRNVREVAAAKYVSGVVSCIMMESTLSFLGLGDATDVTWGGMINLAYKRGGFMMEAYNWLLAPGVCIMLCALSFVLINIFIEKRAKIAGGFLS